MWDGLDLERLRLNFPNNFWQRFILKIIEDDIKEDQFWDYKLNFSFSYPKANRKEIIQEVLKDVTAFANANSGLIIYGIRDELPRKLVKIEKIELGIDHTLQIIENNYLQQFNFFGIPVKVKYKSDLFDCVVFLISKSKELLPVKDYQTGKLIVYVREGPSSKPITDKNKLLSDLISDKVHCILSI